MDLLKREWVNQKVVLGYFISRICNAFVIVVIIIVLIFLLLAIGVASAHGDKAYSSIDINDIKLPNDFNKTWVHSAIKDNIH